MRRPYAWPRLRSSQHSSVPVVVLPRHRGVHAWQTQRQVRPCVPELWRAACRRASTFEALRRVYKGHFDVKFRYSRRSQRRGEQLAGGSFLGSHVVGHAGVITGRSGNLAYNREVGRNGSLSLAVIEILISDDCTERWMRPSDGDAPTGLCSVEGGH